MAKSTLPKEGSGNDDIVRAGFKMKCMKSDVLVEPAIQVVDQHSTISSSDTIKVRQLSSYIACT